MYIKYGNSFFTLSISKLQGNLDSSSNPNSRRSLRRALNTKGVSQIQFEKPISDKTMERRSTSLLRQSISMEIQRGNCASILGTVESPKLLEELFELFDTAKAVSII